jgi:hypothetical protein
MANKFCHVCEEPVPKGRSKYCTKKCATSANNKANYKNRYQETKEYQKSWYEARIKDPEYKAKRARYSREYRESGTGNRMLTAAKDRSKLMGLDFNLELSDIVIPEICPILGVPMVVRGRHAPSLDRIEPAKGYVKGNIQVISRKANVMKNDATPEELKEFALWVLKTYQL